VFSTEHREVAGVVGDHQLLVRTGDRVVERDLQRALGNGMRMPKLATSTPNSLSLVEVSGSGKVASPPTSTAATPSAIA
jgi:hypothetical protein